MSSPMPLVPGVMCSLCFDQIREGEHRVDENGDKWDSHSWCHLMDQAAVLRRDAMRARGVKDNCGCVACKTLRADEFWPMVICSLCGDKRCPKADHHDNECAYARAT